MSSLVSQLTKTYINFEDWHGEEKLSQEEADKYHEKLLGQGSIITVQDGYFLCGYTELWLINYEQFGRIICHERFSAMDEDVVGGNVSYVANVWVHPDYRDKGVLKLMRNRFFDKSKHCKFFVGQALRKKTQPVKVFKVSDIHLKGENNGK